MFYVAWNFCSVHGPYLLSYICKNKEYTETTVQFFMKQLLNGVSWLHAHKIVHLDIKSENILVDVSNIYSPVLKLIDFGNHVRYTLGEKIPANNLEFVAPEVVCDRPLSPATDMWSVGVFLYVFLSGVSPFLDDSSEETSANIQKCDYCFPEDYFRGISPEAIVFVQKLLLVNPEERLSADQCLEAPWIVQVGPISWEKIKISGIEEGSFVTESSSVRDYNVALAEFCGSTDTQGEFCCSYE